MMADLILVVPRQGLDFKRSKPLFDPVIYEFSLFYLQFVYFDMCKKNSNHSQKKQK
jgi:hypothetical protein